jgi:cytochrome oxidase Cu insertion factor (SCO1/SenC/PrrC family)
VLQDPGGADAPLLGLGPGQVALVAFVYRSCTDTNGCPAALGALKRLDRLLAERPAVAARAHLVTVSFDPVHDTPAEMAELRDRMAPRGDWRFLTAPGEAAIEPVLADFGQDAVRDPAQELRIEHVLKLFLVDASGRVRNIYSAGFLDPRILLHDVLTVLGEG